MDVLPSNVQNLISALDRLPGLGPKSAARIAMYLLKMPKDYVKKLGKVLVGLKDEIVYCDICKNIASKSPCSICSSEERDHRIVCVVEDPLDVVAFENGTEFHGVYHVLGGVISPVNGIGPEDLTIDDLMDRIEKEDIKELIIATNPNIEGEATAMYIKKELTDTKDVKVTRLARGLPTGADLEYADKVTIKKAFEGRTEL